MEHAAPNNALAGTEASEEMFSPDLTRMLASPEGAVRRATPSAGARLGGSRQASLASQLRNTAAAGGSVLAFGSPTALPSGVGNLLASPDFRCTFAPPASADTEAPVATTFPGAVAPSSAAAPVAGPLRQTPQAASGSVPQWPAGLSQAPAALPQAQPNFTWVLLPARPFAASHGAPPAPEPALPLSITRPVDGAFGPSANGSFMPAPHAASVPISSAAAAPGSPEGSGTGSDSDSDSPLPRHRGNRAGQFPPSGAAFGRRPMGTADDCFATALDGMGKLPAPLSDSPGLGCTAPPLHTFGLLPGQAQLLAPLLMLSPPTATKGVPAAVQHESAQPRKAPRRPRFANKLAMTAAPATQQPPRQALRKDGRKGQAAASQGAKPLAARGPAVSKRRPAGAPTAGQRGVKQAVGTSRNQKATQAAGGSAGTSMPPRRRAGRKSAAPRKAEAEGHRVVAPPEEQTHGEAPAGRRAPRNAAAKQPAGPAVQPRQPAKGAAGRNKRAADSQPAAPAAKRPRAAKPAPPSRDSQQEPQLAARNQPAPTAAAQPAPAPAGGFVQRAAAVAANAGIRQCAAAEASRAPRAFQPLLDVQDAGSGGMRVNEPDSSEEQAPRGSRTQRAARRTGQTGRGRKDGHRKDPAKVAAALLSKQRVPGQLTRVQRFSLQVLIHVGDRRDVRESEVRREFGNNPDVSKALRLLAGQGNLVRGGNGGRGSPFSYTATAKGRRSVEEARRKLADDAELIRRGREAASASAAEEQPPPTQQQEEQQAGQASEGRG